MMFALLKLREISQVMYLSEISQAFVSIFLFEFYYRTVSYSKFQMKPKWILPTTPVVFRLLYTSLVYLYPEWEIFEMKSVFDILIFMELYRNGRGCIFAFNRSPGRGEYFSLFSYFSMGIYLVSEF